MLNTLQQKYIVVELSDDDLYDERFDAYEDALDFVNNTSHKCLIVAAGHNCNAEPLEVKVENPT